MNAKILSQIEEHGRLHPNKVAIEDPNGINLTYAELITESRKVASYILQNDLQATGLIGIYLPQCYELPIAILATWMAGAAYVPLDPAYPKQRIADILAITDLSCTLTNKDYKKNFPGQNAIETEKAVENFASSFRTLSHRNDLSYLIFTSGTTGKPKGVKISEQNLQNLLATFQKKLKISVEDRLLAIASISFDIFGLELFLPLISGGTCCLTQRVTATDPNLIISCLRKANITILQGTPVTFRLLVDEIWPTDLRLRHILCGGESWDQKLALQILAKMPTACFLWNVYGPTETTIWSSLRRVVIGNDIYITPSVDHTSFYVLDENLTPAEEGILYIGGAGVAQGYYKDDALSTERFIKNPFGLSSHDRLYMTGDFVRRIDEDTYEFICRKDNQIKIRGFRVELGDIEHAILRHPAIEHVVVVYEFVGDDPDRSLIACIQVREDKTTSLNRGQKLHFSEPQHRLDLGRRKDEDNIRTTLPTNDSLKSCHNGRQSSKLNPVVDFRTFLSDYLPSHMIPQYFIEFDSLPLTPNLKTDRDQILKTLQTSSITVGL